MQEMKSQEMTAWKEYQNGLSYQRAIRLPEKIKQNIDFFEGNQWAKPTERTRSLPRPIVNIVKMIVRTKKSAISNTPVKIVYEADTNETDTQKFTHFADYICKEMRLDELDSKAILDAVNKGGYFYHFYWDKDAKGRKGNFDGAVRCDVIDPRNIFFSNPAQTDEQKQKWIIIATREEVESVKAQADEEVNKDLIVADDGEFTKAEQDGTQLCTVLTKYFRKNGEVYCEKSTKTCVFKKEFAISPDYELARKKLGLASKVDAPNTNSPDNVLTDKVASGYRATLYPLAVGQYEYKEQCIYGLSETEGLIANQKCINFNLAMILLSVQQTAWSKWIVKPDALKGQEITNEPGQKLIDWSRSGNGIQKADGVQISALPSQVVDNLLAYTRTVSGSTEVMTGETLGASMSGSAIAQLQAQAQQPIEELRSNFWRVKEKQGKILEQFFRLFYNEPTEFSYKEYKKESNTDETIRDYFNAKDYENVEFTVVAKATKGTRSSSAGDIIFLESLLRAGAITVKQFAESYPNDALSNKDMFIKTLEQSEQNELQQTKEILKQREQELIQASQYLEQYQTIIDASQKTANENKQLKGDIAILYKELCKLQDNANALEQDNQALYDDATLFAQELAKNNALNA